MKLTRENLLLYAVTDRHWLGEETLYEQVEKALKGGATFVQRLSVRRKKYRLFAGAMACLL